MADLKLLSLIENYIYEEIAKRLSSSKIKLSDLLDAPPEFRAEFLSDPMAFRGYQYFMLLKNTYKEPVALLTLYIFERKLGYRVKAIYYHDLIAGSPAWEEGFSGRDLDLVVVFEKKPDLEIVKRVERYIDEIVGLAIWLYFKERGEIEDYKPFNELIGHNLVEIHAIDESEKKRYMLEGGLDNIKVEKADLDKFREKIREMDELSKKIEIKAPIKDNKNLINLDI